MSVSWRSKIMPRRKKLYKASPAPTVDQVGRFLDCFMALCRFDAEMSMFHSMSAFDGSWLKPDPNVVFVREWLEKISGADLDFR